VFSSACSGRDVEAKSSRACAAALRRGFERDFFGAALRATVFFVCDGLPGQRPSSRRLSSPGLLRGSLLHAVFFDAAPLRAVLSSPRLPDDLLRASLLDRPASSRRPS
jgi:hypothetical protein